MSSNADATSTAPTESVTTSTAPIVVNPLIAWSENSDGTCRRVFTGSVSVSTPVVKLSRLDKYLQEDERNTRRQQSEEEIKRRISQHLASDPDLKHQMLRLQTSTVDDKVALQEWSKVVTAACTSDGGAGDVYTIGEPVIIEPGYEGFYKSWV